MADHHQEVLLVGSSQESELLALDAASGATLFTFKQVRSSSGGVAVLPRTGHVAVAQSGKLAVHLLAFGKDVPALKCHVAEPLGPLAASRCGSFLFGGARSGKVYVWEVATGELALVFDAHYKAVAALALSDDDALLVTGGEDAVVHVWRLADLLDGAQDAAASFGGGLSPLASFTEHALPVTAVHVGRGGANARVYTASLDRTCKIWSLNGKQSLYTVSCPASVTCCLADALEQRLFLGAGDGKIYGVDLHAAAAHATATAARIASADGSSAWASGGADRAAPEAFEGHETAVTALQVDAAGARLVSGDDSGGVRVWDAASRQTLRAMQPVKGRVAALVLLPRPADLFHQRGQAKGKATARPQDEDARWSAPLPVAPLKKYMNAQ